MRRLTPLACALWGAGGAALADTDFTALTLQERAVLRAEIRALLLDEPEIVARALSGPSPYAEAVDRDLGVIERHADTLFAGGAAIAIFVAKDCPDCARALDELRTLTDGKGLTFTVLDIHENADLAAALELDATPSYVLPDKMVRGHVPPVVLERYLQD